MRLIADSGSTKTDWRLVGNNGEISQHQTIGLNPYFHDTNSVIEVLTGLKQVVDVQAVDQICFYGSGCSTPDKINIIDRALRRVFIKATIEVHHDLLGAARALCGHSPGIAAILGTGSNSCHYDGKKIVNNMPSLGFVLGDEGSGTHIGKKLIKYYLNNELPKDLAASFNKRFNTNLGEILHQVYKEPYPNRYLASFSKFVFQTIQHPFAAKIVSDSFHKFFDHHICKYAAYQQLPLHVVGSVGYYYGNILRHVANDRGVTLGKVIETPIAGLVLFHTEE